MLVQVDAAEQVVGQTAKRDGGSVSMWALHKSERSGGGARGALQVGDLCFAEDGSEFSGALGSDAIIPETARRGVCGAVREQARVKGRGVDTRANALAAAHSRLVIFVSLRMAASSVVPLSPILLAPILRARGRVENGERVGVSMSTACNARILRCRL
jgi:hypothetical protein